MGSQARSSGAAWVNLGSIPEKNLRFFFASPGASESGCRFSLAGEDGDTGRTRELPRL